jgi:dUTPase
MACVINNSGNFFVIDKGDRICQLAIREAPVIEWEVVSELSKTNRNDKGFGSTGLK